MNPSISKRVFPQILLAILSFIFINAAPAAAMEKVTLIHAGSLTVPLARIEKEFEAANPDIDILRDAGCGYRDHGNRHRPDRRADLRGPALLYQYGQNRVRGDFAATGACLPEPGRFGRRHLFPGDPAAFACRGSPSNRWTCPSIRGSFSACWAPPVRVKSSSLSRWPV